MPTVNKLFGLADPQYDALRVLSTQAVAAGPGDGTTTISGGLLNRIYLWPADGSSLSDYDPDQAGLIAALAAAVSGDTVFLPSIAIAMTAAITIPAGVALISLSYNSILNFSGFAGVAVTLSQGSTALRLTVNFVATGTDATGILAQAADAMVIDPHVNVSGATATNIAIGIGTSQSAQEIWALIYRIGSGYSVAWSKAFDFDDTVNDTAWNAIESFPAGFGNIVVDNLFTMNPDGSDFYISSGAYIWRCTNVPAIRAAPATAPAWEVIADSSTPVGAYNNQEIVAIEWWNDRLCALVRTSQTRYAYGEYFNSVWTWYTQDYDSTAKFPITHLIAARNSGIAIDTMLVYDPTTLAAYYTKPCGFGAGNAQQIWRNYNPDSTAFYTCWKATSATTKIINQAGSTVHDTGLTEKNAADVTGAIQGAAVFVVMQDGESFVSEDGTTFNARATWQAGTLRDAFLSGGGGLVWIRGASNDGDEFFRISLDRGVTTANKTGDFWSVIDVSPSGVEQRGNQLVFY